MSRTTTKGSRRTRLPPGPAAAALIAAATVLLALAGACTGGLEFHVTDVVPATLTRVIDLGPLRLDRIYGGTDGPFARATFDPRGIGFVTGFGAEVVDAETEQPLSGAFPGRGELLLDTHARLLATVPGVSEIRFPDGFGLPLGPILDGLPRDWRGVSVVGMALNPHEESTDREVRVRLRLEYTGPPEDGRPTPLRRLYRVAVPMSLEGAVVLAGPSLRPVEPERVRGLANHWWVEPGMQITRRFERDLVPVAATVHYAVAHLHRYGRSVRLLDVTAGRELWRAEVANDTDADGLPQTPVYSSAEGFAMFPDHAYLIEATYDNRSEQPVDAMATLTLYVQPAGDRTLTYPAPRDGAGL